MFALFDASFFVYLQHCCTFREQMANKCADSQEFVDKSSFPRDQLSCHFLTTDSHVFIDHICRCNNNRCLNNRSCYRHLNCNSKLSRCEKSVSLTVCMHTFVIIAHTLMTNSAHAVNTHTHTHTHMKI